MRFRSFILGVAALAGAVLLVSLGLLAGDHASVYALAASTSYLLVVAALDLFLRALGVEGGPGWGEGRRTRIRGALVIALAALLVPAILFLFLLSKESGDAWSLAQLAVFSVVVVVTGAHAKLLIRSKQGRLAFVAAGAFLGSLVSGLFAIAPGGAASTIATGVVTFALVALAADSALGAIGVDGSWRRGKRARVRAVILAVVALFVAPVLALATLFTWRADPSLAFGRAVVLLVVLVVTALGFRAFRER